ncbi:hypothetical protein [Xanthomonas fragariae]|nr:hypothetical protein [Xanthomonas fragariae]
MQQGKQAFSTGDPDLDRLAAALLADDDVTISRGGFNSDSQHQRL